MQHTGPDIIPAKSLKIQLGISSGPIAFDTLTCISLFSVSSTVITNSSGTGSNDGVGCSGRGSRSVADFPRSGQMEATLTSLSAQVKDILYCTLTQETMQYVYIFSWYCLHDSVISYIFY